MIAVLLKVSDDAVKAYFTPVEGMEIELKSNVIYYVVSFGTFEKDVQLFRSNESDKDKYGYEHIGKIDRSVISDIAREIQDIYYELKQVCHPNDLPVLDIPYEYRGTVTKLYAMHGMFYVTNNMLESDRDLTLKDYVAIGKASRIENIDLIEGSHITSDYELYYKVCDFLEDSKNVLL